MQFAVPSAEGAGVNSRGRKAVDQDVTKVEARRAGTLVRGDAI